MKRCPWVGQNKPYYEQYHDTEWGIPVHDDHKLFEMLILEGAQAGLNWDTILKRREAYREAFKQFDPQLCAQLTNAYLEQLMGAIDDSTLASQPLEAPLRPKECLRPATCSRDPECVPHAPDHPNLQALKTKPTIIRHRLKIFSVPQNAIVFLRIQEEFGSFDQYVWDVVDHKPRINRPDSLQVIPTQTKESRALSKDLKQRGMRFVGPTIMYAYMQAIGMVNDHIKDCFRCLKD